MVRPPQGYALTRFTLGFMLTPAPQAEENVSGNVFGQVVARLRISCCNHSRNFSQEGLAAGRAPLPRWLVVSRLKKVNSHVLVCAHKTCRQQGGRAVLKELKRALKMQDLRARVMVTKVKCLDQCGRGPVVVVYPDGVWYGGVDEACAREIVNEHLAAGRAVGGATILRDMREGNEAK